MFFANSGLWFWLAPLLALPALIHLLNRKFPQRFRFSSIELIRKSQAQRSKLFRWRHWILAVLRTAALLVLLLAFLKPVQAMFGSRAPQAGPRHVLVMFDHSLSMEHREASLSARKRGVMELEKIVSTLGAEDLLNVYAVGREAPACFAEFSTDHTEALSFVRTLEPGFGPADFTKASAAAVKQLNSAPGRSEVYFISDFQRSTWAEVDLAVFPADVRLFFVNVAPGQRANHAILGAQVEGAAGGDASTVQVLLGNYGPEPWKGEVEVVIDGRRSVKGEATVGPWLTETLRLPLAMGGPGLHTLEARATGDDLPEDDRCFFVTRTAEQEEVLIVTDETGGKQQSAGFFLLKALNPYENQKGWLLPKPTASATLTPQKLATTKKIFLTTLDALSPATCQLLAKFVTAGGSIVYFCDGQHDAENLRALDQAAAAQIAPLRLGPKQDVANLPGGSQQIAQGDFKSRFLRVFGGTQRQNLALMEFYEYWHAQPAGQAKVLLTFADGTPAMAVTHPSLGTVLACNFSVNELASNVARQRSFPAWIQDLVKALETNEPPDKPIIPGDVVQTELWQASPRERPVLGPDGKPVRTRTSLEGERLQLSFVAEQPGLYRLGEGSEALAFAVNPPPEESDLRSMDLALLPKRTGADGQAHFVEGQADFAALNAGRPIFHYFIFAVLGLLLAELLLQLIIRPASRRPGSSAQETI